MTMETNAKSMPKSVIRTRVRKTKVRTTPARSQQCERVNSANETRMRNLKRENVSSANATGVRKTILWTVQSHLFAVPFSPFNKHMHIHKHWSQGVEGVHKEKLKKKVSSNGTTCLTPCAFFSPAPCFFFVPSNSELSIRNFGKKAMGLACITRTRYPELKEAILPCHPGLSVGTKWLDWVAGSSVNCDVFAQVPFAPLTLELLTFALLLHFFRIGVASHCWHSYIWHSHSCLIPTVDSFAPLTLSRTVGIRTGVVHTFVFRTLVVQASSSNPLSEHFLNVNPNFIAAL